MQLLSHYYERNEEKRESKVRPVLRPGYTGTLYTSYKSYGKALIRTFGQYCSYCERLDKLDVEHVIPKTKPAGLHLVTSWGNLLLGCPRCNRDFKRSNNDSRASYVWPDTDNTFNMLKYYPDGRVKPRESLDDAIAIMVKNTIDLVKLDDGREDQVVLNNHRKSQFILAEAIKTNYENGNQTLLEVVEFSRVAWSVWMTVFIDLPEVVRALTSDGCISGTNCTYAYST